MKWWQLFLILTAVTAAPHIPPETAKLVYYALFAAYLISTGFKEK